MSCSTRALESGPAVLYRDEDTANKDGCKGLLTAVKCLSPQFCLNLGSSGFGFLWQGRNQEHLQSDLCNQLSVSPKSFLTPPAEQSSVLC